MQFEYDPEKLIDEVKKRPGIWDFDDAEYRAKNIRSKLWKEIVTELMQSDVKISKSEMRELELQLQKKWKSIRDSYQKFIQHPNRTKRPYIYHKQLQFLFNKPSQQQSEAISSESDDTGKQTTKHNAWRFKKKFKMSKEAEQSSDEGNDNTNFNSDNEDDQGSRGFSNNFEEASYPEVPVKVRKIKPDEFVFASVDPQPKSDADDPDKLFLLSLLPHLKAIPEESRLNAKLELMHVLRNASFATSSEQKIF